MRLISIIVIVLLVGLASAQESAKSLPPTIEKVIIGSERKFGLPNLGYLHTAPQAQTDEVKIYNEIWAHLTHQNIVGFIVIGVTLVNGEYMFVAEDDITNIGCVSWALIVDEYPVDMGYLCLGESMHREYENARYYLRVTAPGAFWFLPEFIASLNVTYIGEVEIRYSNFELKNFPAGRDLVVKMPDRESTAPVYYINNNIVRDDPNDAYSKADRITITLYHEPEWISDGRVAVYEYYCDYGISQLKIYARQSDGVLYDKPYPLLPPIPDLLIPLWVILLLAILVVGLAIYIARKKGYKIERNGYRIRIVRE